MNKQTSLNKGLYSIIQYSEQPERLEYVNIGIAVFHSDLSKVHYKFIKTPREINRVFKISLGKHFNFLIDSIQSRLHSEIVDWTTEKDLNKFIGTRAGKIRFSKLMPVAIDQIDDTLNYLFVNLVSSEQPKKRKRSAKSILSERLKNKGVDQLLVKKPEPFKLDAGPTIKADYAYQNGSYNYIQAVSLLGSVDQAVKNVGGLNLEGKWLFDETKGEAQRKLNIVADTADQSTKFIKAVKEVLDTQKVKFFLLSDMEPLFEDIRQSVH